MDKYEAAEIIEKQLCKEIIQIAETIQKTQSMSIQDLDKLDKLYHTHKSKLAAEDMTGEYSSDNQNGISGYRGRAMNGRYVSRDTEASYASGYERGYSEAMNQMRGNNSYSEGYSQGYSEAMSKTQGGNYGYRRW